MTHRLLTGNLTVSKGKASPHEDATVYQSTMTVDDDTVPVVLTILGTRKVEYANGTHVFVTSATWKDSLDNTRLELEAGLEQVSKIAGPGTDVVTGDLMCAVIGWVGELGEWEELEDTDLDDEERPVSQEYLVNVGGGQTAKYVIRRSRLR